jgi:hypothetical protein
MDRHDDQQSDHKEQHRKGDIRFDGPGWSQNQGLAFVLRFLRRLVRAQSRPASLHALSSVIVAFGPLWTASVSHTIHDTLPYR